jgi:opacity protein-like surface antigen
MPRLVAAAATCAVLAFSCARASAQSRFDVGLLLGSTRATDEGQVLRFDRGTTYQATVAWRVWQRSGAMVSVEVPFIASPAFTIVPPSAALPLEYASLYLTPGVRVTAMPSKPVSFFGSVGAGYARYSESRLTGSRLANPAQQDTNTGALQIGAGVDFRAVRWFGFRLEVRDVYTGARNFSLATPRPNVHNVIASGGLILRF